MKRMKCSCAVVVDVDQDHSFEVDIDISYLRGWQGYVKSFFYEYDL